MPEAAPHALESAGKEGLTAGRCPHAHGQAETEHTIDPKHEIDPEFRDLVATSREPWQSRPNSSLDVELRADQPAPKRVCFLGVFAKFVDSVPQEVGQVGASVDLHLGDRLVDQVELLCGLHYVDAQAPDRRDVDCGDGVHVQTVGYTGKGSHQLRLDLVTVPIETSEPFDSVRFRARETAATFAIYNAYFLNDQPPQCPFHSRSGGVTLGEIPSIVRLADRVRLLQALEQLRLSLDKAEDLDEARGLALTFLAMVTAATLELGGVRAHHRVQLEAARELDRLDTVPEIYDATRDRVSELARFLEHDPTAINERLMNRAISYVDRRFGEPLTDTVMAQQLGMSTSHFRHLFRSATGQPFHKFLVAVRLEKARVLLVESQMPITTIAQMVGFSGISHFSRSFMTRFDLSPTDMRRGQADD